MSSGTFVWGFIGLATLVVMRCVRWVKHGDGYWPPGWLGVGLLLVLVIGTPQLIWLTLQRLAHVRQSFWFVFPPLP